MNYRTLKLSLAANLLAAFWIIPAAAQDLTVTDGLQLWLKADAGVTAAAGKVSAWADQSGKGNNASQPATDMSPELVNDAGNGKPALRFDGADDFLEVADSDSVSIAGDITTFYVVKFEDFATYRAVWAKTQVNQPAPNDWYALPGSGIPRAYRGDGTGLNEYADGGKAMPARSFVIAGYGVAGTTLTHYYGAAPTGSGDILTNIPGDAGTSLFIGTRDDRVTLMKGDIAEILIYNRALTDAERVTVVSYLGKKYLFGSLDPAADTDQDGLTNLQEEALASDPTKTDTDEDGLSDGAEVNNYKTSPINGDSDGDILNDGYEVNIAHSDPAKADTDGDGFNDHYEVHLFTNPLDANSKPRKTLVNLFTGPDPGEGLDLDGNFVYAIDMGSEETPGGQVRGALFTGDAVDGVSVVASQVANNWDSRVNYGESADEAALTFIMSSIRWSDAGNATTADVTVKLSNLEVGASYKLQLLFGEYRWSRGFDISIQGRPIADEFGPFEWQGGGRPSQVYSTPATARNNAVPRNNGVVMTHSFIATSTELTVVLDGRPVKNPVMTDHNAIINAATLELLAARTDTDNDGLSDPWEMELIGNLGENGDADTDADGLRNSQEFTADTDPTRADTDGDGVNDGAEVTAGTSPVNSDTDGDGLADGAEATHKADPLKADTDEDGLSDGLEILTYLTDPTKKDSDGDGIEDGKEVAGGTDPAKNEVPAQFSKITLAGFTGGDADEGLDLQGNFRYAINIGTAGAAGKAGDADFTADNAPGIKVTAANEIVAWGGRPEYGDSANDGVIEQVMHSIRYDPRVRVELSGLVPESTYKVQLLFKEQGTSANRGFNVVADGTLLAEAFIPFTIDGGAENPALGAVISAEFITHRDKLVIICDGPAGQAANADITDTNAILDAVTLEILQGGIPVTPPTLRVAKDQANIVITYEGTLQVADAVTGPYTDLAGSSPATITPSGTGKFYRAVRK